MPVLNPQLNTLSQVWRSLNIYQHCIILFPRGQRVDRRPGNSGVYAQSQPAKFKLSSGTGVSTVFGDVEEEDMSEVITYGLCAQGVCS